MLLTKYYSDDKIKNTECGMYGGEEKCIQGFSGEPLGKETTWKTQA